MIYSFVLSVSNAQLLARDAGVAKLALLGVDCGAWWPMGRFCDDSGKTMLSDSMSRILLAVLGVLLIAGCSGVRTFHEYARAGDTVAVAAGWRENFSRDRITIYVTPSDGSPDIVIGPDDPSIRAVVNFYPDPLSSLVVSDRTAQDVTPFAQSYANNVRNSFTAGQSEWFQTVIFFDLPSSLPPGLTKVYIEDPGGDFVSSTLDVVSGVGNANTFSAESAGALTRNHLASLERAAHYEVSFSSAVVPYAIEVAFAHDPDRDANGVGKAYVVEGTGGLKNVTWVDDGVNLRVILMPAGGSALANLSDFSFYVAGGIQNLVPVTTMAFDQNGNEITGVAPTVVPHDIVLTTAN